VVGVSRPEQRPRTAADEPRDHERGNVFREDRERERGPGAREPIPDPLVADIIEQSRSERGINARKISDDEVVERCVFALVNEGARILHEQIAARASDIDVVYLNGYGFPQARGGPMLYADIVGLPNVVRSLERFAAEPGAETWWQPAPLLAKLADDGETFN